MEVSSRPSSNFDPANYAEVNDSTTHTTSKVVIQDITMELHCPLCNDWFHDPLMLSCGHNFCQACIQNYWKLHAKETFCPECTMLCQYSNCTFNLVLEKLVEKIKKLPLLKGHPQCPEHGENLKLFSKPEGKLICFQCKDARLAMGQSKDFLQISDAVRFFTVCETWAVNNPLGKLFWRAASFFWPHLLYSKNEKAQSPQKYNMSWKVLPLEMLHVGKALTIKDYLTPSVTHWVKQRIVSLL